MNNYLYISLLKKLLILFTLCVPFSWSSWTVNAQEKKVKEGQMKLDWQKQEPDWDNKNYAHVSKGQDLSEIIKEWADQMDISVVISPKIKNRVYKTFPLQSSKIFFTSLEKNFPITSYFHNGILYIYSKREMQQKVIRFNNISADYFKEQLVKLGVFSNKFPWKTSPAVFMVYGPPKYLDLISEITSILDKKDNMVLKVFPLRNSWVQDRAISIRGEATSIPGVATILSNLITSFKSQNSAQASSNFSKNIKAMIGNQGAKSLSVVQAKGGFVQADPRRNALIIRDSSKNMPLYKTIIDILDHPTPLIEISMTVVDTTVTDDESFGVKWPSTIDVDLDLENILTKPLVLNTKKLKLSLEFMEKQGDTNIQSEPRITTMDNIEAVIDHSDTYHIRVVSEKNAKLVPITTGTMIRVTPHLVTKKDKDGTSQERINLMLSIEDGSFSANSSVDFIPRVQKSTITTQASVGLNESLIVGGYQREEERVTNSTLPLLGRIPILGTLLFGHKKKTFHTTQRLFIITPRIIDITTNTYVGEEEDAMESRYQEAQGQMIESHEIYDDQYDNRYQYNEQYDRYNDQHYDQYQYNDTPRNRQYRLEDTTSNV